MGNFFIDLAFSSIVRIRKIFFISIYERAFHNSTRHEIPGLMKSDMRSPKTAPGSLRSGVPEGPTGCPYTAGKTAPVSKCPITGIDVSRQVWVPKLIMCTLIELTISCHI